MSHPPKNRSKKEEEEKIKVELPPLALNEAKLIWEQWKYRHQFFWRAFYFTCVTTAFFCTLPLIKTDILSTLDWVALLFPVAGLAFGGFSRSLLRAEYKRLQAVGDAYITAPWNFGGRNQEPFRTDVSKKLDTILEPAEFVAFVVQPIVAFGLTFIAICSLLVQNS